MSTQNAAKSIEILLVEDSKGDVGLIEEVFEDAKIRNNLHVVEDGEEAILYLRGEGQFSGVPRPDIILLDLNLPKKRWPRGSGRNKERRGSQKYTGGGFNHFQS